MPGGKRAGRAQMRTTQCPCQCTQTWKALASAAAHRYMTKSRTRWHRRAYACRCASTRAFVTTMCSSSHWRSVSAAASTHGPACRYNGLSAWAGQTFAGGCARGGDPAVGVSVSSGVRLRRCAIAGRPLTIAAARRPRWGVVPVPPPEACAGAAVPSLAGTGYRHNRSTIAAESAVMEKLTDSAGRNALPQAAPCPDARAADAQRDRRAGAASPEVRTLRDRGACPFASGES